MNSAVDHPQHYTSHPSGVETVEITEHLCFNLGNCVKYLMRRKHKGNELQDLQKALWYANRERARERRRRDDCRIPGGLSERVSRVVSAEATPAIGRAIGLLALADWSDGFARDVFLAVKLIEEEIERLA